MTGTGCLERTGVGIPGLVVAPPTGKAHLSRIPRGPGCSSELSAASPPRPTMQALSLSPPLQMGTLRLGGMTGCAAGMCQPWCARAPASGVLAERPPPIPSEGGTQDESPDVPHPPGDTVHGLPSFAERGWSLRRFFFVFTFSQKGGTFSLTHSGTHPSLCLVTGGLGGDSMRIVPSAKATWMPGVRFFNHETHSLQCGDEIKPKNWNLNEIGSQWFKDPWRVLVLEMKQI